MGLQLRLPLCSYFFGTGRAGSAIHNRVPTLNADKETSAHTVERLSELSVLETNNLMHMYAKQGNLVDARRVFEKMPKRNVVSWNIMILGYSKQEKAILALALYAQMHQEGIQPSARTFIGALKACISLAALEEGKQLDGQSATKVWVEKGRAIHFQVLKRGFESYIYLGNTLVDMYAKSRSMEDAHRVFAELARRDVVSWTAMILGYTKREGGALALEFFARMQQEGILADERTFVGALKACSSMAAMEEGKQGYGNCIKTGCLEKGKALHSQVLKSDFESDVFVGTALVDMYAKCGSMKDASRVFGKLPFRNLVTWTTMIVGHTEQEESEDAFRLFAQMEEQGLSADSRAFVAILKACGNIADLETGKQVHFQISRAGVECITSVANSLIDMYSKSGSMVDAQQLFDTLLTRDVVTWSSLIAGYARQGESGLVFHLFERMRHDGIQPDGVIFLSLLNVCSHVGLVDKGQKYFKAMNNEYGIIPTIEHYNCMADLLGRAGQVDKAVKMVEKMPFQPNIVFWVSVLGACRKWKNVEVGRHAFENAVRLDKKLSAPYILISNIYADAHMWEDLNEIQVMRKKAQAWKKPGQSWWTDLGGMMHTFMAGDRRHPQSKCIYAKLKNLSFKMKEESMSDADCKLQEIYDDEKEDEVCGHSERLAIACALINTPEGTPIRVIKNLRVCDDCHNAIALISKIEPRNIICRDASRFHTYKDGNCSCGNYW